jgi:hypothetical protein
MATTVKLHLHIFFQDVFNLIVLLILSPCSTFSNGSHVDSSVGTPETRYPEDDRGQVWFKLVQWLQRRRFFRKFTVMVIAHMAFWPSNMVTTVIRKRKFDNNFNKKILKNPEKGQLLLYFRKMIHL